MQVSVHASPVLDPRGNQKKPAALAPRPRTLKGSTVLLFDNNQLATMQAQFGPIFKWLAPHLEKQGAKCSHAHEDLIKASGERLAKLADEIAASGVQGVVIALCNAGMTQPSSLFAAALEARGMPCVQICSELGYPLAGVTASNYVPGLPIVVIKPASDDAASFGRTETDVIAPEVVDGLTSEPAKLLAAFHQRFSAGALKTADDGTIRLPEVSVEAPSAAKVEIDAGQFAADLYEQFCDAELCDGFPIIPPTQRRVDEMLRHTDRAPETVLVAELPPSGATVTVKSLAINAVMAGCKPEYFPLVVTAFEAMAEPAYRLFQGAITTHPSGNAIVVSGPLAEEIGMSSGPGCIGPGSRANATIGRAVNLAIANISRSIPGKSDLGVFGSPAEFTYCFAESDANNPWQPLHTELFGADVTSVTVHKCESPHNVLDPRTSPEDLLRTVAAVAATPGGNNSVYPGQILVMLNPPQAKRIANAGWTKRDIREFLFETARHPASMFEGRSVRSHFPPYFLKLERVPVMRSPDDVIIIVAGGRGNHAMVSLPWGLAQAVHRPVALKDGTPIRSLKASTIRN